MMRIWCWLFATCVTATPPPPPAPLPPAAPAAPPAVAGQMRPGPDEESEAAPDEAAPPAKAPPPAIQLSLTMPRPAPPAAVAPAKPPPPAQGRPTLAVVVEEMGVNASQSARAIALPGAVTLSWLPFAPHLADQVAAAAARGHEAMLDMPMEALGRLDPGPDALRTWLPPASNLASLRAALDLVPGAVALNPHEGGVAVLSVPLMDLVMGELQARRMAFLDSPGMPHSVALGRAEAAGVPAAGRDLCIDGDPNPAAIRARLAEAEEIARRAGHAILIGHTRAGTLDVLEQYLPTAAARGFVLWPVSAGIAAETGHERAAAEGVAQTVVAPPAGSGAE
jgi:uncharacterized protein